MQGQSDAQLLCQYAREGSERAFSELVARHTDLIYSAALRQVEAPDLAQDVAQSVFIDLARKARLLADQLNPDASVVGWLYRSTRFAASDLRRAARRRQTRENLAMKELQPADPPTESIVDWPRLRPLLDDALSNLGDTDREALLLRFFKNQDFKAVGLAMGMSDDAAQKRVSRALEKLRGLLARRGVATSATALSLAISANAVQGAPGGLAIWLSNAALASTGGVPTALAATKLLAMTTIQKTLIGATLAVALGTGFHQARRASQLSQRLQALQQQQSALSDQLEQVTRDRDRTLTQLTASRQEGQRLRSQSQSPGQVAASSSADPTEAAMNAWVRRINLLRQRLEQTPEAKIPELRFLKDLDWVEVAAKTKLENDTEYRKALAELRRRADGYFVEQVHSALGRYLQANHGQWPESLSPMAAYFDPPVERALWERWEIVPATALPADQFASQFVITEASAVDPEFDSRHVVDGPSSCQIEPYHPYGYQPPPSEEEALKSTLEPVLAAYKSANGGKEPDDPSEMQAYATTPEQQAALRRAIALINQPRTERYGATFRSSTVQRTHGDGN